MSSERKHRAPLSAVSEFPESRPEDQILGPVVASAREFDFRFSDKTKAILTILSEVYQEIVKAPVETLNHLERWINHPRPRCKLDEDQAEEFVKSYHQGDFPRWMVRSLEAFVKWWPLILSAMREGDFIDESWKALAIFQRYRLPAYLAEHTWSPIPRYYRDPEHPYQLLVYSLATRQPVDVLRLGADAKDYLRNDPVLYLGSCEAIKGFREAVNFGPPAHRGLVDEAEKLLGWAKTWSGLEKLYSESPRFPWNQEER